MTLENVLMITKIVCFACLIIIALDLTFYILSWLFIFIVTRFYKRQKEYSAPSNFSYKLLNFGYKIICSLARVKIHYNLKASSSNQTVCLPEEKFMFVSNHISKFDNMVQSLCLGNKNRIAFVSKQENFKIPIGGRLIKRNCYISLERGVGKSAIKMIFDSVRLIKENISSVGIYPEGKRSTDGKLLPFKPGVFKIAERASSPVLVGTIRNTDKIHKNFPFKKTHVYFDIIKVYTAEEINKYNTNELCAEIEKLVQNHLTSAVSGLTHEV
ncbi:MAG: 1-acyl-sn-glycerol-3-phosphate acyltransferase [Treponema sp.]|nr:1-acyl-sn-glycerol-3-phosphate acyltransferase [Treponema sp.]